MAITAKIVGRPSAPTGAKAIHPVVASGRAPRTATPQVGAWRDHFPFGVFIDAAGATASMRDMSKNDGTGHTVDCTNPGGLRELIYHPEAGLLANGLNYIIWTNGDAAGEAVNGWSEIIEAVPQDMWQVIAPMVQVDAAWFNNEGISHTDGEADTIVNGILSVYADNPSVLAWNMWDDTATSTQADRLATIVRSFIRNDPYQRPCSAVIVRTAVEDTIQDNGGVVTFSYNYPCGDLVGGTPTAEGDMRREQNGSSVDWVPRIDLSIRNPDLTYWMITQAHQTNDDYVNDPTDLRYPYPSEFPLITWLTIGEGYKGIFWFAFNDLSPHWDGIGSVASRDRMKAIGRMGKRLTDNIRRRLLNTTKVSAAFTTSGGGSSVYTGSFSYANAYVSTLYDSDADTYYCILCNRSTSSASVTVSSASLFGDLVNLETGSRFRLGTAVTLPALDGGIWMFDPIVGVPHWDINYSVSVTTWWGTHWANPASANYIAPADITLNSNVVTVTNGQNLQTVINSHPDWTTFSLAAGASFGWVRLVDREGIHIVSANAGNPATVCGIEIFGSTESIYYNPTSTPTVGFPRKLIAGTQPAKSAHLNPARNFIIRDIEFTSDGTVGNYEYYTIDGSQQHDHYNSYSPLWFSNCQDILVEGCTINGSTYLTSTDVGGGSFSLTLNDFDWNHIALINANRGIKNLVVRNSSFDNPDVGNGLKKGSATYLDGAMGCIFEGNEFGVGSLDNYSSGCHIYLSNDDFSLDAHLDGRYQVDMDQRHPRYNVIANNTYGFYRQFVDTQGFQNLFIDNDVNLQGGGVTVFAMVHTRTSRLAPLGVQMFHYDNVFTGTTFTNGTLNYGVIHVPDDAGTDETVRNRARVGRSTVTNNTAGAAPTNGWGPIDRKSDVLTASETASDGPNTVSGNT